MPKSPKKSPSMEGKPLNFKVTPEFHRAFKTYAAQHGMSMRELLEQGFQLVKRQKA